ncbi:MAG TPA: M48 family metallopeptidase [Terriglobales bacterium]|nr:M48 family metallopeptidase [Terriglobales bacterium]
MAALLLATQSFPQSAGPEFPNPGNPHMSREQQRSLGLQAAAQVYQQMPVLPDSSPETQYIRKLGQKLVTTIPPQYSWPFEFHVVRQKEINAFALPGGPMFVNIGTITAAANEAELAGVMAHEMSHVYMQHSAKQEEKAEWTSGLAQLAGGILGATTGGSIGQLAQAGIQFGAQGLMLKYSRTDESQADAVGAMILYKAGYNPKALADFFKALESQGGGAPPQWLSDHPNPGNREQAIEKEIRDWPAKSYATDSAAFQEIRQQALGVKAYTAEEIAAGAKTGQWAAINKKEGAALNSSGVREVNTKAPVPAASLQSVLPSPQMVRTDFGMMKIAHPENWPVTMPQHQADYVTIAPQAGVTPNGVGYGVLINAAKANGQGINLDDTTVELVQHLQRTHGVKPVSNAEAIAVNGVQGRSVMMQSVSPFPSANGQQQLERDWLVVLQRSPDVMMFFVFVAPQSDFARFQPTYEAMLKTVQF